MLQLVTQVANKRFKSFAVIYGAKIRFLKTIHREELSWKETYDIDLRLQI